MMHPGLQDNGLTTDTMRTPHCGGFSIFRHGIDARGLTGSAAGAQGRRPWPSDAW